MYWELIFGKYIWEKKDGAGNVTEPARHIRGLGTPKEITREEYLKFYEPVPAPMEVDQNGCVEVAMMPDVLPSEELQAIHDEIGRQQPWPTSPFWSR